VIPYSTPEIESHSDFLLPRAENLSRAALLGEQKSDVLTQFAASGGARRGQSVRFNPTVKLETYVRGNNARCS